MSLDGNRCGCGRMALVPHVCDTHDERLRAEFLRLLTEDSETTDRRRREFNQAIFAPINEETGRGGYAIWNGLDLTMVMSKFDRAVRNLRG